MYTYILQYSYIFWTCIPIASGCTILGSLLTASQMTGLAGRPCPVPPS